MNVDLNNVSNTDIYQLLMNINHQNGEINKRLERIENNYKQEISLVTGKIELLEQENTKIKEQLLFTQKQSKKYNIVIYGVGENEIDLRQFVLKIINETLEINSEPTNIRDIYRIGKKIPNKQRPVVVELVSYTTKLNIIKNGRKLKGTGLYVCPDLTPEELKDKKILVENLKLAREKQLSAKIVNNKLVVNGETYTATQLKNSSTTFPSLPETAEHTETRQVNSAPATPNPSEDINTVFYNADGNNVNQSSVPEKPEERKKKENEETVAERIVKKRKKTLE